MYLGSVFQPTIRMIVKVLLKFATISYLIVLLVLLSLFGGCKDKSHTSEADPLSAGTVEARFTLLSSEESGISFVNEIKEDFALNFYTYEYLYNGSGIAVGDVNGDSLPDIYFGSTIKSNKLYLNLGGMKFADITDASGVGLADGFKSGTTMADVNGDGRLDIYCCRSSKVIDGKKSDKLFINTGNRLMNNMQVPIFEDQTKKLGLEDDSNTNHACFFDYDNDGDLDLFQLNHRIGFANSGQIRLEQNPDGSVKRITTPLTPYESNRMYRNDDGHFTDVTEKAGLVSSAFGLSATVADINQDGWLDIYCGNDLVEPDFIYINNGNGTFTDHYTSYIKHSSQNSMGSDVADINNDGLPDIIVLDMKAEDPFRYKQLMTPMTFDRYNIMVQYGYGRQAGRNVLQLNNGNNTFSEIGQYAGVATTDWSWGSLFADLDNDGWKDTYIANGYRKDVTNLDYMNYFRDSIDRTGGLTTKRFPDFNEFLKYIPEQKISNYLFINAKNLSFINATVAAGMDQPTFSNGASYADLDMDGDLDLIVSNIGDRAFIYRNDVSGKHWLQIKVENPGGNTLGIGTTANLYTGGMHQYSMLNSNKGFLSSSEPLLHFGLDTISTVDSIILTWPDGSKEILRDVKADQRIYWKRNTGTSYKAQEKPKPSSLFTNVPGAIQWHHQENKFIDFKREKLLPYMLSAEGPCISVGDINGDKLEDVFAGNGKGFPSAIFIQNADRTFSRLREPAFEKDTVFETCSSVLEDFDGDGDLDLLAGSGGNFAPVNSPDYMTRLYMNDGKGVFVKTSGFPVIKANTGYILAYDFDNDKDKDLFIAGKCTPGAFPVAPRSYLLRNDNGKFKDVTEEVFPQFAEAGMISDMETGDLDGDGKDELIVVGDWMPVSVYSFNGQKYKDITKDYGFEKTCGWWKCVNVTDIDGDGDRDIIAGNMGLNHRLRATVTQPVTLVAKDFDANGSVDPIMCFYYQDKLYPFVGRDELIAQIPSLKKIFTRYKTYATATLQDVFIPEDLEGSMYLYTHTFMTTLYLNDKGKFKVHEIPYQAQWSPVYDVVIKDFDGDGKKDILMAGNFLYAETETGEMDAGNGTLLIQNANGSFNYVPNIDHGFWAQGEVRELKSIKLGTDKEALLTGNNQGTIDVQMILNTRQK